MLKHKGYTGYVEYDDEGKIFHGEVLDTKDAITFQRRDVNEIEKAFRESIDDYLEFCKEKLLSGINKNNRHNEIDFGKRRGNEYW